MSKNFESKFWSFSFYLLFFAAAASLFNFLALYLKNEGLPGTQIGALMGISSILGLFVGPLWNGLADATHRHRLVLSIGIIGSLAAYFCFPFVHSFWLYLLLIILGAVFGASIVSLVDNATMFSLGDEKDKYGRVRLGGTIGFGLAAPIVGAIVDRYGMQWIFWIYCALLMLALITVVRMRFSQTVSEGSFLHGVRGLLTDRKWILFLMIVFIAGSGNLAISAYLFIYLQKIGTNSTLMGLAITISTIAELPALFFADRLLRRMKPGGLLMLGLIATGIRCMLYGMIDIPWMALTVQLLQVVTFPILLVAGVSYADENAPIGMGATAQAIFNSAFMGFGFAAGGFLGGALIEYIGVQPMFLVFGAAILLAALIFGLAQRMQTVPQQVS